MSEANDKIPKRVDLLRIVDPRVDRVQGIWFFEKNGRLRSPVESEARLQVPVVPPQSYVLRMKVERLQGVEQFGIGVMVGGRQTMISIDNSNSGFTGLHNLDGKPAADNESMKRGTFLPLHRWSAWNVGSGMTRFNSTSTTRKSSIGTATRRGYRYRPIGPFHTVTGCSSQPTTQRLKSDPSHWRS
jgi:hypothetical protein